MDVNLRTFVDCSIDASWFSVKTQRTHTHTHTLRDPHNTNNRDIAYSCELYDLSLKSIRFEDGMVDTFDVRSCPPSQT